MLLPLRCPLGSISLSIPDRLLSRLGLLRASNVSDITLNEKGWFLNGRPQELVYISSWPWMTLQLKDQLTSQIKTIRILKGQVSQENYWKLSLLYRVQFSQGIKKGLQ